jgi:hypothetical protein
MHAPNWRAWSQQSKFPGITKKLRWLIFLRHTWETSLYFWWLSAIRPHHWADLKYEATSRIGLFVGWDYLLLKFQERVTKDLRLLDFDRWERMAEGEFTSLFADDRLGSLLVGNDQRVELINDLGRKLRERRWTVADQLLELCEANTNCSTVA